MLTVFIATRNGERQLPAVLQSFTELLAPPSGWKLVVIDNGSTDGTREIVEGFQQVLPVKYLFESRPGKNAALNTGLAELEGDLAVFTDDDVFPRRDWLVQLRRAADEHNSFAMFGGVVLPRWEREPPEWISKLDVKGYFSVTDPNLAEGPVAADWLFGPNMAIRAEVFQQGTRFDDSIGPRGRNYAMGSETELVLRLERQGCKSWHVQQAVVEHFIRGYQLEKPWLLGRAVRYGRGAFRLCSDLPPWPRIAARILKRLARIALATVRRTETEEFIARLELNYNWGVLVEGFRRRKRR